MTMNNCIEIIDYINYRFRKMKHSWYEWVIKIDWDKIMKWYKILKKENNKKGEENEI